MQLINNAKLAVLFTETLQKKFHQSPLPYVEGTNPPEVKVSRRLCFRVIHADGSVVARVCPARRLLVAPRGRLRGGDNQKHEDERTLERSIHRKGRPDHIYIYPSWTRLTPFH